MVLSIARSWVLAGVAMLLIACQVSLSEPVNLPEITAIYPSSDTLPANLLRMYIHFSQPMRTVGNLEEIRLLDSQGEPVIGAIFNNAYELWDREQKQLTIIFDPARVKTGLQANERYGRALQVGERYELSIDRLQAANGDWMTAPYVKSFQVTAEDVIAPAKENWQLTLPKAASRQPLRIAFPQSLDHFSLLQRLVLTDAARERIPGQVSIADQEREWRFTPTKPWPAGSYVLYIDTRLEDPAGNNLNGLFDHEVGSLKNSREGVIEQMIVEIVDSK